MIESKLYGETKNILEENITKLKELFPEILTEDKIDFDKLKSLLSDEIDDSPERYNFIWNGKNKAIAEAQKPSTGTLRPCKEESKDWNLTGNLYIEGDNLEVLKLLQKSYYNKIKMIYIDPPYNTGKDFIYPDNYKDNLENYLELTGQIKPNLDSEKIDTIKLSTNTETSGRYHTNWLNMMYPRLKLARSLLSENGVIFISINENEQANLKKICDEIFGEDEFITQFVWEKGKEGGNDSNIMRSHYENILCYGKNIHANEIINLDKKDTSRHITQLPEKNLVKGIENEINSGEPFQLINLSKQKDYNVNIELLNGEIIKWDSYAPQKSIDNWIKMGKVFVGQKKVPYIKSFLKDEIQGQKPSNILIQKYGTTKSGSIEIRELLRNKKIFPYPKPSKLVIRLLEIGSHKDSIVLDFFSGSATVAHSIFSINGKNNGNRKFIMVQLPEPTDEKSEAFKAGYKTIAEIGKERIRRAGDKIKHESNYKDLDIGFKVFKLDSSNLKKWDPDYKDSEQAVLTSVDNIKPDRSEFDLLYEIMLKYGINLTLPIEEYEIKDKMVYSVGFGALLICLDDEITSEIATEIIRLKEELSPETTRVVVKDNGFKSDSDKTNIKETLKTNGIDEFITI